MFFSLVAIACQKINQPKVLDIPDISSKHNYTEFQFSILNQGQLILVEDNGVIWPTYRTDNVLLESNPPKLHLTRYVDGKQLVTSVTALISPFAIDTDTYRAQVLLNQKWQDTQNFKLNEHQYMVKMEQVWRNVENQTIRFIKFK